MCVMIGLTLHSQEQNVPESETTIYEKQISKSFITKVVKANDKLHYRETIKVDASEWCRQPLSNY